MSTFSFSNISLRAFAAAAPSNVIQFNTTERRVAKFVKQIGIEQVHISVTEQTPVDLGYVALTHALSRVNWQANELDLVIFDTQFPDFYGGSGDASLIHHYLNLREDCAVFDLPVGCSAFPYSLSIACSMMECSSDIKRVAVLNGDPCWVKFDSKEKLIEQQQHLFGECTGAILLEKVKSSHYNISTRLFAQGNGYKHIFLYPSSCDIWHSNASKLAMPDGVITKQDSKSIKLYMNGMAIHEFSTGKVVDSIKEQYGTKIKDFDYYIFHQANKQILTTITQRLELDPNKVLVSLDKYGNTSAASAITTICHKLHDIGHPVHVFNASFGIGLSWGFSDFVIIPGTVSAIIPTEHHFTEHCLKPTYEEQPALSANS